MTRRWLLFSVVLAIASLACFAFPLYVIRPFRHQDAGELALALSISRFGPVISTVCAALTITTVWLVWSGSRKRLPRISSVLLALVSIGGALLARFNVYEMMFHPIDEPRFENARNVKVDGDDMVIAVELKRARRAYPIREMAYHHVVNDTVAGEPIVATY